ncbi:MAG: chromosomal replication initiator protein DnaA [Blastocatellia bacterium]|nr:chromosomal replication initiator protein DnaA [Blastocatellia bacterium]MBL8195312.1 chromosomal replication initiator protein DnaA [Blastocatellia bacterium]MBN8725221.1 chromosomal replication initiator protein DnaA [Acidobacteriota bacterium]
MKSSPNLWDSILSLIKEKINHQSFDTWFEPITFLSNSNNVIYLTAPDKVFENWIIENYSEEISKALSDLGLSNYRIIFSFNDKGKQSNNFRNKDFFDSQESIKASPSLVYSGFDDSGLDEFVSTRFVDIEPIETPLNQKYSFENFVVGSSNQFAHAAAQAVAAAPSKAYNPLFIYGGVGLGKTHLMHAIGHTIRSRNRHLRLVYISAEKFMNELINAIRYDKTLTFREKYRSIDVLLVDDIQFIAGKERTQEEFFHTFNALYDAQKQIVISSDCPPKEIPTLEERLHSRFEWGLLADIQPPDLETKVAILRRKAELEKIDLENDLALFIASKIKSNVRELEGSLVRLVAYSSLKKQPITLQLAQEVLRNIIDEDERGISIETIQKVVASHYGLKVNDLKSKNNSRSIAIPRQVAMYLCKTLTKASLPEIGREFGGKHHTTVLHSVNKITSLYQTDKDFHRVINSLTSSLK